ncbi:hypothetical protein NE237_030358 [Protea cynaroides]|uniref:IBR domain-containing protein n=1 Tax=Protea cynaroides TaxID=273540 RepID=A0A9Q0GSX3_9MAGN|nr:hypothetical protein NE237_030358 [Protea cynaroides]
MTHINKFKNRKRCVHPFCRNCIGFNCLVLLLNECGGNIIRSKCPNCKKLLCFQCKLPWHAGFGCDETGEMRNENDILFGKLIERNKWKIYSGCKYRVEHNEGCQNIKCRLSKEAFRCAIGATGLTFLGDGDADLITGDDLALADVDKGLSVDLVNLLGLDIEVALSVQDD